MKFKKALNTITLSLISTTLFSTSVFALTFNDVPTSYWGYSAIDSISNKGLMVGDLNGNFRPNAYIDRFETSIVLARLLGYKTTGATTEEEEYYNQCYNTQIDLINQYDAKFDKWSTYSNREIAFLLEKAVLLPSDLNHFVYETSNGGESINVLTKEDIAVFIVRALDAVDASNNLAVYEKFSDDSSISTDKKNSVYYLRSIGIINGDNNNKYNPKNPITRAEMATLMSKTYDYMYDDTDSNTGTDSGNTGDVTNISTVTGTIETYYDTLDTVQVKTSAGASNIYVLDDDVTITINGYEKSKSDLKEGMYCVFVVEGGKTITDVRATSSDISTGGNTGSGNSGNGNSGNTGSTTDDVTTELAGTVESVDAFARTISVSIKTLSPKGDITETTYKYNVVDDTSITKDGEDIYLGQIEKGDIITCDLTGNNVENIVVEEKYAKFDGKVVDKGYDDSNERGYYVIENDDTDKEDTYYVDKDSDIERDGDEVSWNTIKVGDNVTVVSTFGVIDEIYASGEKSKDTCYVRGINIAEGGGYILVSDKKDDDEITKYWIGSDVDNVYKLKIGAEVKLYLDSDEVYDIDILSEPTYDPVNGVVDDIYRDRITVTTSGNVTKTIYYDEDVTLFIDSTTGKYNTIDDIDSGDTIYAVYADDESKIASTITLIDEYED